MRPVPNRQEHDEMDKCGRDEKGGIANLLNPELDRRKFLKTAGVLASTIPAGVALLKARPSAAVVVGQNPADRVETDSSVAIRYTSCQNCHARCGLMAKVVDGVLVKLDGNPYHPNNMESDERLPYATPVDQARLTRGRICAKGQSGIQAVYDPYRVKNPLKRVGPRGSGQWESVSWDQALDDIASRLLVLRDLQTPIDPSFPELGPIANQLLFSPGRFPGGEQPVGDRFFKDGFGTINFRHDHTSICEVSHHVANDLITWDKPNKKGRKNHFKPDIIESKYIILFGANPLEANFPMVALARKFMEMKRRGGRYVVVDPRLSNSAAQAYRWIPIRPGTDAALALGMARWIVDNGRHDVRYLENPNQAAATADGEKTWSDATWLVRLDNWTYLRADALGIGGNDRFVVVSGGAAALHDLAAQGDLDVSTTLGGIAVKSVFRLLLERLREKSLAEYSEICGVDAGTIASLATEFTSFGKKAVANTYRGAVQHTNGVYNQLSVMVLNTLVGNYDWKGGNATGGGSWSDMGNKTPPPPGSVDLTKVPGGVSPSGIPLTRVKKTYEKDAPNLFARDGYPARRPWFPHGGYGNYQEVIPSAADGYPYRIRALVTYWNAWPYSTPALRRVFEQYVRDETQLEFFVAIDTQIGENSMWADYILPDATYLEKWAVPGGNAAILTKLSPTRLPVVGTFDGKPWNAPFDPNAANNYVGVVPDARMVHDILIDLGKRMGLPGFGPNAFADGSSLDNWWDFAKKQIQNIAADSGKSVDDILAKGGAFEDSTGEYAGEYLAHAYANEVHLYIEELASSKDSMTGTPFDGLPRYEPIQMADGTPVDDSGFPFHLVTYKPAIHAQARTASLPWLMMLRPENGVEMNAADAAALGIETGDKVRVTSSSHSTGIVGKAIVIQGIRPGVVAICHSYGHWAIGSDNPAVDGQKQAGDSTRGTGIQPTQIMRLDTSLGNVTLQDRIGCSAAFYDTRVRVEKVA